MCLATSMALRPEGAGRARMTDWRLLWAGRRVGSEGETRATGRTLGLHRHGRPARTWGEG